MSLEGLEKERDFYFGKLRDIEVMCQDCDNSGDPPPIVQKILDVLYATEVNYISQVVSFLHYKQSYVYRIRYVLFSGRFCTTRRTGGRRSSARRRGGILTFFYLRL